MQDPNGKVRSVDRISVQDEDNKLRSAYVLKMNINGVLRTIWELIVAFVFSSDGFGIQTQDGYIIKLKDQ